LFFFKNKEAARKYYGHYLDYLNNLNSARKRGTGKEKRAMRMDGVLLAIAFVLVVLSILMGSTCHSSLNEPIMHTVNNPSTKNLP
jgi:hypothetical protein